MKACLLAIAICLLSFYTCIAQKKYVPRNLTQAIVFLQKNCPDSLKAVIKKTSDNKLTELVYPGGNYDSYKVINNWLSDDYSNVKISRYLASKGITDFGHKQAVILIAFKDQLLGKAVNINGILKPYQALETQWNKEDQVRSTTDSLRGHYIPKDIEDCFKKLDGMFEDSDKVKAKIMTEDDFISRYYIGLGFWLMNNWCLGDGSRISAYFNKIGVYNNESMAGIILVSYYRHLLDKPIDLAGQAEKDKKFWADAKAKTLAESIARFNDYKIGDTVVYEHCYGYGTEQEKDSAIEQQCSSTGIVMERDSGKLFIKVKILNTCGQKGIVIFDSRKVLSYDKKQKKWIHPKKREIKRSYRNDELWFRYSCWYKND